jgi:membrane-associated phospholipid phosphatase
LGAGIGGTMLFTNTFKKSFGRERPYFKFAAPGRRAELNGDDARESFYSSHATTAFFAAAFADPVLADLIRTTRPDYGLGIEAPWSMRMLRFGQAFALYGLAAAVGVSRIVDDQHFMTDVLTGAFAGTLQGYLTYRWGYRSPATQTVEISGFPAGSGVMVHYRF